MKGKIACFTHVIEYDRTEQCKGPALKLIGKQRFDAFQRFGWHDPKPLVLSVKAPGKEEFKVFCNESDKQLLPWIAVRHAPVFGAVTTTEIWRPTIRINWIQPKRFFRAGFSPECPNVACLKQVSKQSPLDFWTWFLVSKILDPRLRSHGKRHPSKRRLFCPTVYCMILLLECPKVSCLCTLVPKHNVSKIAHDLASWSSHRAGVQLSGHLPIQVGVAQKWHLRCFYLQKWHRLFYHFVWRISLRRIQPRSSHKHQREGSAFFPKPCKGVSLCLPMCLPVRPFSLLFGKTKFCFRNDVHAVYTCMWYLSWRHLCPGRTLQGETDDTSVKKMVAAKSQPCGIVWKTPLLVHVFSRFVAESVDFIRCDRIAKTWRRNATKQRFWDGGGFGSRVSRALPLCSSV